VLDKVILHSYNVACHFVQKEILVRRQQDSNVDSELFSNVSRPSTLTSQVVKQMEEIIVRHSEPGSRFPSERELASQFGVSRTVVREAVSGLTMRGLLRTIPGSGTVIGSPSSESVSQVMSLFLRTGEGSLDYSQVHEVRRVLEVEIAGLAAERHLPEDIETIEGLISQMEGVRHDRQGYAASDVEFHRALAKATRNSLFVLMLDALADVMFAVRELGFDVPTSFDHGLKYHRRIFEAVRNGDAAEAREAMLEHIVDSEDLMRQALEIGIHSQTDAV